MELLVVSQQFHICATALETFLELDLILNDQSLALVVDRRGELGGNGMVGSWILDHETLVPSDAREHCRLFDSPFANIGPVLVGFGVFLLCM